MSARNYSDRIIPTNRPEQIDEHQRQRPLQSHNPLSVIFGFIVGFIVAFVILAPSIRPIERPANLLRFEDGHLPPLDDNSYNHRYGFHFDRDNETIKGDEIGYVGEHSESDTFHKMTSTSLAESLKKKVRVLCWIMTSPENHETKAKHVKATWGKRCNILLFMSSKEDSTLPTISLNVSEGRDNLWAKTKAAYKYVYDHYFDQADWFMKADDDTYVIVENLRYMLFPTSPNTPIYYGCKFKTLVKQGFMSGGSGYVLSKEALRRFVEEGLPDAKKCRQDGGGAEDVEIGKCLAAVNVTAGDSRDPEKRGRFFPLPPTYHLIPGGVDKNFWYWQIIYYNDTKGMNCCSDNAVSFHYIEPSMMYAMEYMIYHLKPFGIAYNPVLPDNLNKTQNYSDVKEEMKG